MPSCSRDAARPAAGIGGAARFSHADSDTGRGQSAATPRPCSVLQGLGAGRTAAVLPPVSPRLPRAAALKQQLSSGRARSSCLSAPRAIIRRCQKARLLPGGRVGHRHMPGSVCAAPGPGGVRLR